MHLRSLAARIVTGSALLLAAVAPPSVLGQSGPSAASPRTYCNPLPIPNYPIGRNVRDLARGDKTDDSSLWFVDRVDQYRELADPTAIWFDGKWILYPSVDMAWVSADMGATWQHHPLNIRDVGYAPTVVRQGDRFLLMASSSSIYVASSPLGPFKEIGRPALPRGVPDTLDPMLFVDDGGRLYFYWGCSETRGIWGVELDPNNPVRTLGEPKQLIPFAPETFPWEQVGEFNQNSGAGWIEASWMIKHQGKYILTFSAAGTEHRAYATGAYVGTAPLGPFRPQARNPIFRTTSGLVTGTGHGSIIQGPGGQWWTFYTIAAGAAHGFERRVGMDPVEFDAQGEIFVPRATSTPQWLPGTAADRKGPSDTGWIPVNGGVQTIGSSNAPNLTGRLAVDTDLRTWWQPAADDTTPALTSRFYGPATISAVRIAWRDVGLDSTRGIVPGPYRYRVELETAANQWRTVLDRTASTEDLLVDYREIQPTAGTRARLVITGWPKGVTPGVAEFTLFGTAVARTK
jgi:xylan 1,4-beta-xylosidase